jgi:hypothetical protein
MCGVRPTESRLHVCEGLKRNDTSVNRPRQATSTKTALAYERAGPRTGV